MNEVDKKGFLFPLLFIVALTTLGYLKILGGFFQQDEWLGFARMILLGDKDFWRFILHIFSPIGLHYNPLNLLSLFALFNIFLVNYNLYALVSILLHLIVVYLIFWFGMLIFKDLRLALFTSLLFGILAATFQATAWVVTDISIHGATIFGLLGVISFFNFLEKRKNLFLLTSTLSIFISLLFKEVAISLFIFLPLVGYFYDKKDKLPRFRILLLFGFFGLLYISLRVFLLTNSIPLAGNSVNQPQLPISPREFSYNLITHPARALLQSFIPEGQIKNISDFIGPLILEDLRDIKGTPEYDLEIARKVIDPVIFFLASLILFVVLKVLYTAKNREFGKIIFLSLLWITTNSLIFAFSPEREGVIHFIDSRNMYFPAIGSVFLISGLIARLARSNVWKMYIGFLIFISVNMFWLQKDLDVVVERGKIRLSILENVSNFYPDLPEKVIFYTESDKAYYGLPPNDRIMPFQSGFGQTLLIWYYSTENFPIDFVKNKFLWEIADQGYKEAQGRGFGYFRNFDLATKTLKEYELSRDSVFSFRYDSGLRVIEDNTKEVRGRIAGFFANKRQILSIALLSSHNVQDLQFAVDGKRETFWDSKAPYAQPQSIEVSLGSQKRIVQITIDSYNNKNQNEVGYLVLLSQDKQNWREVFYSKRYPPGADGLVNLYFEPQKATYIKIEQKGYHEYASWLINELKIYEAI